MPRHRALSCGVKPVLASIAASMIVAAFMLLPACADEPATLAPATLAIDGWVARCDGIACKASLASASHDEALLIARWTGNQGVSIGIATPRAIIDRDRSIDVRVDDKTLLNLKSGHDYTALERVESFWIIDTPVANTLLQAMVKGNHLRLSYLDMVGAPHDADFATESLVKILAFFDQEQHTKSGAVIGMAPPTTVARAPEMSRIDLITRMGLPERLLIRHARASDCEDPASPRLKSVSPVIGPLSRTAILYAIPCSATGNDITYRIWVIETGEIGGITPQYFALFDPMFGWKGSDLLYNVTFDASAGRLTSSVKPTNAGTCGHHASWHWKSYGFALDTFDLSADCNTGHHAKIYPPT